MAGEGGSSVLGALLFCCLFSVATLTQTPNESLAKQGKGGVEINVWLIRHGSREDWEEPNWKETSKFPHDPALSSMGIQQAQQLAQFLKSQNVTLDEVYSSPFLRTLQTCAIVLDEMKVTEKKVRVENGLSEWFHRGETLSYMPPEEIYKLPFLLDRIDQSYQPILKERPHLETPKGLHIRAKNFVQRLTDILEQTAASATAAATALKELDNEISFEGEDNNPKEEESDFFSESYDVLLVSHAAPIIALARAFVGDIEVQLAPGTCTLTKLTKVLSSSPSPSPTSCPPWKMIMNSESGFLSTGNYKAYVFEGELQKQVTDAQE